MRLSNFKYLITDIGGGWSYNHILYAVTPDGKVYTTMNFDEDNLSLDTELEFEFCGQLDKVECVIDNPRPDYAVMDASEITVYEISTKIEIIYNAWDWRNPEFVDDVKKIVSDYNWNKYYKNKNLGDKQVVGELDTSEEMREAIKVMSSGHPINTTFHGSADFGFGLPYGKKLSDEDKTKLIEYFKNQPNIKEFFNNISEKVKEQDSEVPKMRDLLLHTLMCRPDFNYNDYDTTNLRDKTDEELKEQFSSANTQAEKDCIIAELCRRRKENE